MAHTNPALLTRRLSLVLAGTAVVLLAGCVVAPVGPYDVGTPVAYPAYPAYGSYPVYAGPSYYGWPYWGAPAVSLSLYGRVGGGHHRPSWNRPNHGGSHWAPGNRPQGHGGVNRGGRGSRH